MGPEIKLVITHNNKVVQTVSKDLNGQGFVKCIEDFQLIANATMTKLIEDAGDSDCIIEEEADDSDNEEDNVCVSPKKRKK